MNLVKTRMEDGVLHIKLASGKANTLIPRLVDELTEVLKNAQKDYGVNILVLGSENPKFFSTGFDLKILSTMNQSELTKFFHRFVKLCRLLFCLPKPTIAAIEGHAIAGGLILALCCDTRLLKNGKALTGLNELKVGVPIPLGTIAMLQGIVTPRAAREIVSWGKNYQPEEALRIGLIDALVDEADFDRQLGEWISSLKAKSLPAYAETKRYLQRETLAKMQDDEKEVKTFIDIWFSEDTQKRVQILLAELEGK